MAIDHSVINIITSLHLRDQAWRSKFLRSHVENKLS